MAVPANMSADGAAALVRATDSLGVPLGPGQPAAFLDALGERTTFDELVVHAALLVDLYPLFLRPGVRPRSGFFGRPSGASPTRELTCSSCRRTSGGSRRSLSASRIVATAAAPADEHGNLGLSLHAGTTVDELVRAAATLPASCSSNSCARAATLPASCSWR